MLVSCVLAINRIPSRIRVPRVFFSPLFVPSKKGRIVVVLGGGGGERREKKVFSSLFHPSRIESSDANSRIRDTKDDLYAFIVGYGIIGD